MSKIKKEDAIENLRLAHDYIKEHPYRLNFSPAYESGYAHALVNKLSKAWEELIYLSDVSEEEGRLFQKFGAWIHNYNAHISSKKYRLSREDFQYYEMMLQVTHRYLETGDLSTFWKIEYQGKGSDKITIIQKYYLCTKEMCGIESPELPCYFPENVRLCEDEKAMKDYLDKYKKYYNPDKLLDEWKQNTLPLIKWHNNNLAEGKQTEKAAWESL